jgi:hypothetical protein
MQIEANISLQPTSSVPRDFYPPQCQKCPPMVGFCESAASLQAPSSVQREIADSLRRIFKIFPFLGDGDRRPTQPSNRLWSVHGKGSSFGICASESAAGCRPSKIADVMSGERNASRSA